MDLSRSFASAGSLAIAAALWCSATAAFAQIPAAAPTAKVVVSGVVPDEATRNAILIHAREVFGADRVVDQLGVDKLVAPPNWVLHVQRAISPELKKVSQGQIRITGNTVDLVGDVDSEATKHQVVQQLSTQINNPTYLIRDGLRAAGSGQKALDDTLARRTIEFEPGNARLTTAGAAVLDQLIPILKQMAGRRFEVVGHTDNQGSRESNLQLSAARAQAVKDYLVTHGIAPGDIVTSGAGPDRPLYGNQTSEGRAKNRRIEFRVLA